MNLEKLNVVKLTPQEVKEIEGGKWLEIFKAIWDVITTPFEFY
jgi:hypothetical protein